MNWKTWAILAVKVASFVAAIQLNQKEAVIAVNAGDAIEAILKSIKERPIVCSFNRTTPCRVGAGHECWILATGQPIYKGKAKTWLRCPYYGKVPT